MSEMRLKSCGRVTSKTKTPLSFPCYGYSVWKLKFLLGFTKKGGALRKSASELTVSAHVQRRKRKRPSVK